MKLEYDAKKDIFTLAGREIRAGQLLRVKFNNHWKQCRLTYDADKDRYSFDYMQGITVTAHDVELTAAMQRREEYESP